MTSELISKLIEDECAAATFIPLAQAFTPFRIKPVVRSLRWPFAKDTPEIACWIVADLTSEKEGMTLAYSEAGHGAYGHKWGLVMQTDKDIGRDDSWFLHLEDAFISAGVWHQPLPEEYEVR